MKTLKQDEEKTPKAPARDAAPEPSSELAVKAGDRIQLARSGIVSCGEFKAGTVYTVGEGKGQVSPARAHRLVTVKGFRVNPPAKAKDTEKKE